MNHPNGCLLRLPGALEPGLKVLPHWQLRLLFWGTCKQLYVAVEVTSHIKLASPYSWP